MASTSGQRDAEPGASPVKCHVCLTDLDNSQRGPRTLSCGHSLCTPCNGCLGDLRRTTCPTCRAGHAVPHGEQLPVSSSINELWRRLRNIEAAGTATGAARFPSHGAKKDKAVATCASQREAAGLGLRIRSLLKEEEVRVLAAMRTCREVKAQLGRYEKMVAAWCEQQQQLEGGMQRLMDQSSSARELMEQERERAVTKKEEVKEGEQLLENALQSLREVTAPVEVVPAIDDADQWAKEESNKARQCVGTFPDVRVARAAMKAKESLSAAVKAAEDVQVSMQTTPGVPRVPSSTICERLQEVMTPLASRVPGDPPVPPCHPCLVFLDLAWPGSGHRRVYIRVSPDTPLGKQFVLLCTGQRGPSYANTRLLTVQNKERPGECVVGGDYDTNNGEGGASLVPNLSRGAYQRSWQAGAVWGIWSGEPARGAQFCIRTRDREDHVSCAKVFGKVVRGLEDVVAAAQHSDVTEVTVEGCGLLLWE